jgi:lipid A 4'-phosphatase
MSLMRRYFNARIFKWDWLFFSLCLIFFVIFPDFDLLVAQLTWRPETQFEFADLAWVRFLYLVFSKIHFVYLAFLIYWMIASWFKQALQTKHRLQLHATFLLVALVLGPGLVVNQVFKENWGRARPREVVEFGGTKQYSPPFEIQKACDGNCSFVSGHASGAFFILTLSWVFRQRRWFWFSLVLGGLVGMGRVLQGGHFVSDVVFAFWAVYFSSLMTAMAFNLRSSIPSQSVRAMSSKSRSISLD